LLEKKQKREQRRRDQAFFAEMERNILASLERGEKIPGAIDLEKEGPPVEPEELPEPKCRVRTISGMNEHLLAQLNDPTSILMPVKPFRYGNGSNQPTTKVMEGRPPLPPSHPHPQRPAPTSPLDSPPDSDDLRGEDFLESPLMSEYDDNLAETPPKRDQKTAPSKLTPLSHVRRNTGGTMFVKSTMEKPDVNATIQCVCGVYRAHIVQSVAKVVVTGGSDDHRTTLHHAAVNMDVFRDDHYEFQYHESKEPEHVPSLQEIQAFYMDFYQRSQMEHDTIIMSLIYVERLIKETHGALTPSPENWRSVLFSCMILASKVWDDLSMWNVDFSNVSAASGLSMFSLQRINQLELAVLTCLNFAVAVPASEYAKYFFLLRTMQNRSGLLEHAARPLSQQDAARLERRTEHYQDSKLHHAGGAKRRRPKSIDWSGWWQRRGDSAVGPVLKDSVCLEQLVSTSSDQSQPRDRPSPPAAK
jgi:hypothetical protein